MALYKAAVRLSPALHLYEDRLEKLLVFYPEWVKSVLDTLEKNPRLARMHQELNQAVEGLVRSSGAVREIAQRDASEALLDVVPKALGILKAAERAAFKLDDAALRFQVAVQSGAPPPYKKEILYCRKALSSYMKVLQPLHQGLGLAMPRLASDRPALIRLASTLPKGSGERRAILAVIQRMARGAFNLPGKHILDHAAVTGRAMVSDDAVVRDRVRVFGQAWVGDNAVVSGDVSIGDKAIVHSNAVVAGKVLVRDNARIGDNARVHGNVEMYGMATVKERATVSGHVLLEGRATIYGQAKVRDNAMVLEHGKVSGSATVGGNAKIVGKSKVSGNARVEGDAVVYDLARVYGKAYVYGKARIGGSAEILGGKWDGSEGEITEGIWRSPLERVK